MFLNNDFGISSVSMYAVLADVVFVVEETEGQNLHEKVELTELGMAVRIMNAPVLGHLWGVAEK